MFKLEKVMDGFCASAPQQRGQQNPNVDYVPYEQMKGRILKIVDDFHGWVKASTSTDYKGLQSVAHICIFWISFQNSIHYSASLRTPHRPEAKLHGNWQVSLGLGEGERLLLRKCSVFSRSIRNVQGWFSFLCRMWWWSVASPPHQSKDL